MSTGKFFTLFIFIITLISCSNTTKVVEETYPDGKKKLVKIYSEKAGIKELIEEIHYYQNEAIKMKGSYSNNQREGLWTSYFENGKKWSEGYFKNGLDDGRRIVWYESGLKRYEGFFNAGKKVGIWKFYDTTGVVLKEIDYK